eukprot:jgi/Botrbrau1/4623/Bobra.60_2s0106.1
MLWIYPDDGVAHHKPGTHCMHIGLSVIFFKGLVMLGGGQGTPCMYGGHGEYWWCLHNLDSACAGSCTLSLLSRHFVNVSVSDRSRLSTTIRVVDSGRITPKWPHSTSTITNLADLVLRVICRPTGVAISLKASLAEGTFALQANWLAFRPWKAASYLRNAVLSGQVAADLEGSTSILRHA